jgi:hypothetical protein
MKRQYRKKRTQKLFQSVPMYAVPAHTLFDEEGKLILQGVTLSVYLYCCRLANDQPKRGDGKFEFRVEDVVAETGYKERAVWSALQDLQRDKLIVRLEEKCKRSLHAFSISTSDGFALYREYGESRTSPSPLRKFLFDKKLWYDDTPQYLFDNLKPLKGAPLAIALAAYQLAIDKEQVQFAVNFKTWREKSDVARRSLFEQAWVLPEFKNFIHASRLPRAEEVQVTFYHPTKGTSLVRARSNAAGRAFMRELDRPVDEYGNSSDRKYTSEEIIKCIRKFYPDAEQNREGVLVVECPKCHGWGGGFRAAPPPTLRFDPDKGAFGVMYCGADLGNRGNCDYGTRKMTYHLLAERRNIEAGQAMKIFQSYIRELRGEDRNLPPEDLQNGADATVEQENAAEEALRRLQESI